MLVLTRRIGETVVLDDTIRVRVVRVSGKRVTLAIEAPDDVKILRGELADRERHEVDEPSDAPSDRAAESLLAVH